MEPSATFHFAPEIEAALVAAAFAAPWHIGTLRRELDPAIHFSRVDCRHVLEAIEAVYRELGATDFASVVSFLRENGRLKECGGPQAVSAILSEYRYGFSSPRARKEIIRHYIECLQAYALARTASPPLKPCFFTGGKGTLLPNKVKRSAASPDWTGETVVAGKHYHTSAWVAHNAEFINLRLAPTP
jgi:DnaB-like helicase N terminal domain